MKLSQAIAEWERRFRTSFGDRIDTPRQRLLSSIHFELFDHALLRHLWTNLDQIAPGAYRSNQPGPARVARYARMGIKTIVTLRGRAQRAHYLFEQEACARHGIDLIDVSLHAKKPCDRDEMLRLIDIFPSLPRPFLMHCKSGADRAGLASVLYLMTQEGLSLEQARPHLGLRYLHLKGSRAGVLDHMFKQYAADTAQTPTPIRDWIATKYDAQALADSFARK
ncbi:protein tyrosine phosphatase [Thalassobius sp. S69A]|uniref:protein tyrosine phosphatase n=1 Tax=unclassified Thalassovita TaxID=2619711 RepID=UPI000C0E45D5|nr:protein tyrosine phosphatase [Paracoccaceae bacterium]MBT26504.1 protein tyrosine phosphatase [Paracoccaceae bacterium]